MPSFTHKDSIIVDAPPEKVYEVVSDITRTGEWSPVCVACWWDEGDRPEEGAWFTGRNQTPTRTWETRSQVAVAQPGREFTWVVSGKYARWGYTLEPTDDGTLLTESWHFLDAGIAFFHEKYGDDASEQIQDRIDAAHSGIPETLARIKAVVEQG